MVRDPELWRKLIQLATMREDQGRPLGAYELPKLCGIAPSEAMWYLDEMAKERGWSTLDEMVLIPVDDNGNDLVPDEVMA